MTPHSLPHPLSRSWGTLGEPRSGDGGTADDSATLTCGRHRSAMGPDKCCFSYYERPVKFNKVRSYELTDQRCPKTAVILTTLSNRTICANPRTQWVKNAMEKLDDRNF
ncbi:C-C motif chemokine 8 [Merluccius polli]|uniref:C-C motif chemokine 8 n=1 Tax=Merluccius polli TaxID=89951 RepID=A0AA47NRY1_MERPO|nr:C-C motif chemokine 8 [Merluccius polli]